MLYFVIFCLCLKSFPTSWHFLGCETAPRLESAQEALRDWRPRRLRLLEILLQEEPVPGLPGVLGGWDWWIGWTSLVTVTKND